MLQSQKEALREELLDTRMERDGYLNDRSIMFTVRYLCVYVCVCVCV